MSKFNKSLFGALIIAVIGGVVYGLFTAGYSEGFYKGREQGLEAARGTLAEHSSNVVYEAVIVLKKGDTYYTPGHRAPHLSPGEKVAISNDGFWMKVQ